MTPIDYELQILSQKIEQLQADLTKVIGMNTDLQNRVYRLEEGRIKK